MKGKIGVRLLVTIALLSFVLASYPFLLKKQPVKPERVIVNVEPGMSFYELSEVLEKKQVVKSAYLLRIQAAQEGIDKRLKPGKYIFEAPSDYSKVLSIIEKGPEIELVKVTIPEGFSNRQIASRLSKALGLDEKEVLDFLNSSKKRFTHEFPFLNSYNGDSLEGFLFPDTYYLKKNSDLDEIARKFLENFSSKAQQIGLLKNLEEATPDLYKIVIVASIVEKEAKLPEERPIIASVFYNRLKSGMKLQSCATVEYVLGFSKAVLTEEDLKIDSPYNTYLYEGLPPGPICNPGVESLKAALNPAKTKYLYFVLIDKSGKHYFAETYSEFLRAKKKRPK